MGGLKYVRRRYLRLGDRPGTHIALLALLLAGAALRLWFTLSYRPAFVGYPDAGAYLLAAHGPLYWNPYKPVGYPLFLRALHAIDDRLSFVVIVQHLLGLGTAVLAYLATGRFVRRPWIALLPAVVVLFGGTQVFLEHSVLSDAPYTFLLMLALYCAVRSLDGGARLWLLAATGAVLGASVTLRTEGLFVVPVIALWALIRARLTWRERGGGAAVLLGAVLLVLVAYLIPQHAVTGSWGLTRTAGLTFYARMAPIADCTRFTPPAGTAGLCQRNKPSARPNANWYIFDLNSPAIRLYGVPPYPLRRVPKSAYSWRGETPTRRFALAVLTHQPLDYLATVAEGLANYVVPRAGAQSVFEYDQRKLIAELHNPHFEQAAIPDITSYYATGPGYLRRNVSALDDYGRTAKVEGAVTAVLALLLLAGWSLSHGREREAASLFASTAIMLAVVPVAFLFYDARYTEAMDVPLAIAAAFGVDCLWERFEPRVRSLARRIRSRS